MPPRSPVPLLRLVARQFPGDGDPRAAIEAGRVEVDGLINRNPASRVNPSARLRLIGDQPLRGEAKLSAGLDHFGLDPAGRVCIDVGASAGGFTRVLLNRGARRVYAVDAGHGQLLGSLRQDERVVNLEATNVSELTPELVPDTVELVVIDVSYLALRTAVSQLAGLRLAPRCDLVGLVKPMFELRLPTAPLGGEEVDRAGRLASEGITAAGWRVMGVVESPVTGAHGARELLLHAVYEVTF